MAYTTPVTKAAGQTLAAAEWNAGVRDNFETVAKPPYAWLYLTAAQSIPHASMTKVNWNASLILRGMTYSAGTVTISEAGIYRVQYLLYIASAAGGLRSGTIYQNGTIRWDCQMNPSNGTTKWGTSMDLNCAAGDTVDVRVYQDSGGSLSLSAGSTNASAVQVCMVSR